MTKHYPLTAPAAKPDTILRWKRRTSITRGIVVKNDAAEISPHGIVCSPWKRAIPTGIVCFEGSVIMRSARKNSFHACIKQRIAAVKMPGADRGSATCLKAFSLEHPSTRAANSKSLGISRKKTASIHVTRGREIAT